MTTTNRNAKTTIETLAAEAERCLAELRTLPRTRKCAARRAMTQRRYAEIGVEMRGAATMTAIPMPTAANPRTAREVARWREHLAIAGWYEEDGFWAHPSANGLHNMKAAIEQTLRWADE